MGRDEPYHYLWRLLDPARTAGRPRQALHPPHRRERGAEVRDVSRPESTHPDGAVRNVEVKGRAGRGGVTPSPPHRGWRPRSRSETARRLLRVRDDLERPRPRPPDSPLAGRGLPCTVSVLAVADPEVAVARVARRVAQGGHGAYLIGGEPAHGVLLGDEARRGCRTRQFAPDALWRSDSALTVHFKYEPDEPDDDRVAEWRREIWNRGSRRCCGWCPRSGSISTTASAGRWNPGTPPPIGSGRSAP